MLKVEILTGLAEMDVETRLHEFGPNRLQEPPARSVWLKFADQFRSLLVLVLIAAAVVAGAVGEIKDAVVIGLVVIVNAVLGFMQEHRAEAALAALKGMLAPVSRVRREGCVVQVATQEIVPGDVLLLEAGDRVPADARVVAAFGAEATEAALTGESQPVAKLVDAVSATAPLAERSSMIFMNTVISRGRLEAVVTATGMATEMGRLAGLLAQAKEMQTPLQVELDHLGKRLAAIAGAVVALYFVLGLLRGDGVLTTAMTAIALAVAAIPEGLPAVVTVTLALGMQRMASRNAIVKKLAAVETLGCTTVICSDKTGTLTLNQMTARGFYFAGRRFSVDGEGYDEAGSVRCLDGDAIPDLRRLGLSAALCADARLRSGKLIGDPTEGAMLALSAKLGVLQEAAMQSFPRIAELPFDSASKYMATFHPDGEFVQMWVKGAPDVLLARSTLDAAACSVYEQENRVFADEAMRVLAVAGRRIPASQFDAAGDFQVWVAELEMVALVGIIDPPRPEAREAIALCQAAGIQVKMITGDHRATAAAIARELGLQGEVHEGRELDGLAAPEMAALVERSAVFARVAPEHKLRIVKALQLQGHVVAMTGDGVNDAPALKSADIGVAMGITGTEVSKEAAAMVLADDNFSSIVGAVQEGRTIYDNIVKFVRFQLSTNLGAMATLIGASLLGYAAPFTAIQILWINIIMDGPPAMSLGVEPARPDIMRAMPRQSGAAILSHRRLAVLAMFGLVMATGTLTAYAWGLQHADHAHAVTLAFTTFVLFQFFNIFNARAENGTAFNRQLFSNGKLWLALATVVVLQVVAVHWAPAQSIFGTVDLEVSDWAWSVAIASTVLWVEEARKLVRRMMVR